MTPPSQPSADSPLHASGLSDEWRELHRVLGEYRQWGNLGTTATTFAAVSAEAITHCDRIAKACDALLDSLRVAPVPLPEGAGEPTPTIRDLQRINQARSDRWMAGSPGWTKLEIAGELAGECGELANVCKKLRRSELGVRGNKVTDAELIEQARGELGDVFIVTMLVASKLGIDLYDATRAAFNAKSEQMGFPERFPALHPEQEPANG